MTHLRLTAEFFGALVEGSAAAESDHYSIFGVSIGGRRVLGPVKRKRHIGGWTYRRMTSDEEADYGALTLGDQDEG